MTIKIDNHPIIFQPIQESDMDNLLKYLYDLSDESKKRFGPHPFTLEHLFLMHKKPNEYFMFISKIAQTDCIITYCVLKKGWIDYEQSRLNSYGLVPSEGDFTVAPSVADSWQGKGLGTAFFNYIVNYAVNNLNAKRLILWGGVQKSNSCAIKLYQKFGFTQLGEFEYFGSNLDMFLKI